jgi:hypothetical protein
LVPAESKAQFRWLHTDDAKEKLGAKGVSEWLGATGSPKGRPERKKKKKSDSMSSYMEEK